MDSENRKLKNAKSGGRLKKRPPEKNTRNKKSTAAARVKKTRKSTARRANNSAPVSSADAGARRSAVSARSRKTRARQDAAEHELRSRRTKTAKQSEVKPFKFSDVHESKRAPRKDNGHMAAVVYSVLLAAAVIAIVVFICSVFFEVRSIKCEGNTKYTATEIANYSGINIGDKMMMLKRGKAADKIISALPYIKTVSIRQHFPTTVYISIKERTPAAKITDGILSYIVDGEGYLLEESILGSSFDLPQVLCPDPVDPVPGKQLRFEDPLMLETMQTVLGYICATQWIDNISTIDIQKTYAVSFMYQDRLQVKLGDASNLDMKMKLLAEVISRNSEDAVGVIDVSSTDHVSFQPGH